MEHISVCARKRGVFWQGGLLPTFIWAFYLQVRPLLNDSTHQEMPPTISVGSAQDGDGLLAYLLTHEAFQTKDFAKKVE